MTAAESIPAIPWDEFVSRFRWAQGEHLAAVAPTGAGKTTLFSELMPYRRFSLMLGTKPDDKLYREIIAKRGFRRIESVSQIRSYDEKLLLWPKQRPTIRESVVAQQNAFREAFDMVVAQQAWTLWVDEAKYIAEYLRLRTELTYCLEQLRSINATVISGAQRPAWLPPSVLANSTHLFLWKSTRREDAQKLADVGGIDAKLIAEAAKSLDEHEFIYIKSRGTTSQVVRSEVGKK